jgi:hypothetical protein
MIKRKISKSFQAMIPITLAMSSFSMAQTTGTASPVASPSAPSVSVVANFIGDSNYTTNVYDLTAKVPAKASPVSQPWSGSYWPLHEGSIGNPYAEGGNDWINFVTRLVLESPGAEEKHYESRMAKIRAAVDSLTQKLDDKTIDEMAPSEKYDLYIGDHDFSLTASVWLSMMEQVKVFGHIASWEGSCQGWTTAASFSPRPGKAIKVMSLDGKYLIPFYPDDLKALSTLLWANSLIQDNTVFEGERCVSNDPNFDAATGHVNDQNCAGVAPNDFHVTLLEMIGARKQPFIVDRSNSTQVWNQPIAGYELKYFNPISGDEKDLKDAVVKRSDYPDPYDAYRNKATVSIVGVHMRLRYVSETLPAHRATDDASKDTVKNLDLIYDLELDANSQIIGGQWRDSEDSDATHNQNDDGEEDTASIPKFPGFIWKFKTSTPMAMSVADADLPATDLSTVNHEALLAASRKAGTFRYKLYKTDQNGNTVFDRAQLRPQPLEKVVTALVNLSTAK